MAKRLRRKCPCGRMIAQNADGGLFPHIHNAGYVAQQEAAAAAERAAKQAEAEAEFRAGERLKNAKLAERVQQHLSTPEATVPETGSYLGWQLLALALNTLERADEDPTPYADRTRIGVRGARGRVELDDGIGWSVYVADE